MQIKVYATLRDVVGGPSVQLDHVTQLTIGEVIDRLFTQYPDMRPLLLKGNGELHSAFHILVNGRDARYLNGLETTVSARDEIRIFPPVGGGLA